MEIGGGVKNARVCNHHLVKKMTDLRGRGEPLILNGVPVAFGIKSLPL